MPVNQTAERKRIARELHDTLGQYLAALQLGLSAIEQRCAFNQGVRQRLAELKTLASTLGLELHRFASELWPMALDDLGLQWAVPQYLEELTEGSSLYFDLELDLNDRRLPASVETALFGVLQETIGNVVKHPGAVRVGVILQAADHEVRLVVEDNVRGFGADEREPEAEDLKWRDIRERVSLVGGSLEVEASERGSTTVFVRIPL